MNKRFKFTTYFLTTILLIFFLSKCKEPPPKYIGYIGKTHAISFIQFLNEERYKEAYSQFTNEAKKTQSYDNFLGILKKRTNGHKCYSLNLPGGTEFYYEDYASYIKMGRIAWEGFFKTDCGENRKYNETIIVFYTEDSQYKIHSYRIHKGDKSIKKKMELDNFLAKEVEQVKKTIINDLAK